MDGYRLVLQTFTGKPEDKMKKAIDPPKMTLMRTIFTEYSTKGIRNTQEL